MAALVLYHRTTIGNARDVAKRGFEDDKWRFGPPDELGHAGVTSVGVWLTDRPLGADEGPDGDAVLEVTLDVSEESIETFELIDVIHETRLWVVPARLINPNVSVRILEVDPRTSWWYEVPDADGD